MILDVWSATPSATCKAAENDCLERRNSIRPCVPSHVAYKAERGGDEPFWSPWTTYPRSRERHRNREATVYLPALGGDGPRREIEGAASILGVQSADTHRGDKISRISKLPFKARCYREGLLWRTPELAGS